MAQRKGDQKDRRVCSVQVPKEELSLAFKRVWVASLWAPPLDPVKITQQKSLCVSTDTWLPEPEYRCVSAPRVYLGFGQDRWSLSC